MIIWFLRFGWRSLHKFLDNSPNPSCHSGSIRQPSLVHAESTCLDWIYEPNSNECSSDIAAFVDGVLSQLRCGHRIFITTPDAGDLPLPIVGLLDMQFVMSMILSLSGVGRLGNWRLGHWWLGTGDWGCWCLVGWMWVVYWLHPIYSRVT